MAGRFAPSPTSVLHVGNLRTALVAWLMARSSGRDFLIRIEDLDVTRVAAAPAVAQGQLDDLAAIGLTADGEVVRQSDRLPRYAAALSALETYECYCTRREIAEEASAPHDDGYRPYPGTCRDLSDAERAARRAGRPPELRVRSPGETVTVDDEWHGRVSGVVDDFVVRRNDGGYAYNLAVVVDDIAQGVDQVVRGDDLLSSAPRQAWLTQKLGGAVPLYGHVPLVVGADGRRLAKRDGAITLGDLAGLGWTPAQALTLLGASLGLVTEAEASEEALVSPETLLKRFDPGTLPRTPWVLPVLSSR